MRTIISFSSIKLLINILHLYYYCYLLHLLYSYNIISRMLKNVREAVQESIKQRGNK